MNVESPVEIWGGLECTINRVRDSYFDQLEYCGHYTRQKDADLIASLGIKMLRYPVLWEKYLPSRDVPVDWSCAEYNLIRLRELNVSPIVGLVHHGSGPKYVNFFDGSFEEGLTEYARLVAQKFPWIEYYTPVNEPLTTARFCGLYGIWYPHKNDMYSFYKILLSECKATVMGMKAIREINPQAKLIETEDLSRCYSTPLLAYQANYENHRRWLSYDLLCGRVDEKHVMWKNMIESGITREEIVFFRKNKCVPYIAGFNYYITSERYLDEDLAKYPSQYHGGNGIHSYADIETVKVKLSEPSGPAVLLKEAWKHIQLPIAITECHLHSTREEQMRWFHEMWQTSNQLKSEGVDIRGITAWAIFGLYGWNKLVTEPWGDYEPGVFNVRSGVPRPTALAMLLKTLSSEQEFYHPVLEASGWWKRETRFLHSIKNNKEIPVRKRINCKPLLIIGKANPLGVLFSHMCHEREIYHTAINDLDFFLNNTGYLEKIIREINPWAIVDASGYYRKIEEAESQKAFCFQANCEGPSVLAKICSRLSVKLLSFSTDMVFDGTKKAPYHESDPVKPINVYGLSKARGEEAILRNHPDALILRTGSLFSPWEDDSLLSGILLDMKQGKEVLAARDVFLSPSYVPDVISCGLELLLDDEKGIFHAANNGAASWAELARKIAHLSGYDPSLVREVSSANIFSPVPLPSYRVLESEKGLLLPKLDGALEHYITVTHSRNVNAA